MEIIESTIKFAKLCNIIKNDKISKLIIDAKVRNKKTGKSVPKFILREN